VVMPSWLHMCTHVVCKPFKIRLKFDCDRYHRIEKQGPLQYPEVALVPSRIKILEPKLSWKLSLSNY